MPSIVSLVHADFTGRCERGVEVRTLDTEAGGLGHLVAGAAVGAEELAAAILEASGDRRRGGCATTCGQSGKHAGGEEEGGNLGEGLGSAHGLDRSSAILYVGAAFAARPELR